MHCIITNLGFLKQTWIFNSVLNMEFPSSHLHNLDND